MIPCGSVGENEPPKTEEPSPAVPIASEHIQQAVKSLMLKMKRNPEAVAKVMQSLPTLVKDSEASGSKANSLIAAMAAANLDPTRVHALQEQLLAAGTATGNVNSANAANTAVPGPTAAAALTAPPVAAPPPPVQAAGAAAVPADKTSAIAAAAAMLTAHRLRKAQAQQEQGMPPQPSAALMAQLQKSFGGALQQQQQSVAVKQLPTTSRPVSPPLRFPVVHGPGAAGGATGVPPLPHGVVGAPLLQHGFSAAGIVPKSEVATGPGGQQMMSIADLRQALGGLVAAQNGVGSQLAASTGLLSQAVAAANGIPIPAGNTAAAANQQTSDLTPLSLQAMMAKVLNARGAQRGMGQRVMGGPYPGDGRGPVKSMQPPMNRQRFQQLTHSDLAPNNSNSYPATGHSHQSTVDGQSTSAPPYMSQYPPGSSNASGMSSAQPLQYSQPRRDGGYMNRPSPFGVSAQAQDQQGRALSRYRQVPGQMDRLSMPNSLNENRSHGQYIAGGGRMPSVFQAGGPRGQPRMVAPQQHPAGNSTSAFSKEKVLEDWQRNVLCAVAYGSQLQASVSQTRFGERLPGLLANLAEDSATASHVFDAILTGASRAVLKDTSDGPLSADSKLKRCMRTRPTTVQVWSEQGAYMGRSRPRYRYEGGVRPAVVSEKRKWFDRIFDSKRVRRRRRYAHIADAIRYNHHIEEFNSEESDVEEILRSADTVAEDSPVCGGERKRGLGACSSGAGVEGRVVKRICSEDTKSGTDKPFAVKQGSTEECEWLFDGAGVAEELALCFHPRPDNPLRQELMKLKWSLRSPLLEPIPENVSKDILNFQVPKLVRNESESLPEYYFSATIAASRAESNILAEARNSARLNSAVGAAVVGRFSGRSSRDAGFVCAEDAVGPVSSSTTERVRNRFISVANSNRRNNAAAAAGQGAAAGGGNGAGGGHAAASAKGNAAGAHFGADGGESRVAEPEVSLSLYAEKIGQANSPEDVIGAATEGERPFDLVKKYTGWHPYVWFLMCRRPEMYSLGVEAGLVAKIAGEEWGGLQRQNRVLGFLQRVLEFVHEHPVPRTSDKKAMKVYKQLAAKIVRTPLMGSTTTAMRAALFTGSGGPSGSGGSEAEEEDVSSHSRRSCVSGRRAASVAAAAVVAPVAAASVASANVGVASVGSGGVVKDEDKKRSGGDEAEDANWQ